MSKSTRKPVTKSAPAAAAKAKAAKRAPGNAKALQQKAASNLAKLNARKDKAETIATVVTARTGNGLVICTNRDRNIVIQRVDATVTKLASIGQLVAPLEEYLRSQPKPTARLAKGVDSHNSPQSAKAVADQNRAKATAPAKGKAPAAKGTKNKQPSRGTNRAYTIGKTENKARPDTWRYYMLQTIMGCADMDSAKAAHAKSKQYPSNKLDFTWADAQGYIRFTK